MAAAILNDFQTSIISLFSLKTKPLFGLTIDSKGMQEKVWFMYLSCTSLNQDAKNSEEMKYMETLSPKTSGLLQLLQS